MGSRTKSFMPRQGSLSKLMASMNSVIGRDINGKERTALDFLHEDPLFSTVKKNQKKKLAKLLEVQMYNKGDVIVRKGDISDALYIIAHGVVEFSDNRDGRKINLRKFAVGEMFGEFGLVNKSPRTLTAAAYSDTVSVLVLRGQDFQANKDKPFMTPIADRVTKINKTMMAGGLTQIDFLKDVDTETITQIGNLFRYEIHPEGTTLFREGDPGDRFYLVYSGVLVLTIKDDAGFDIELARVGPGKTFGEKSLLKDTQRSATITTLEQTELFSLGRQQFSQFRYFLPEIDQKLSDRLNKTSVATLVPIFQSLSIKQKLNLDSIARKVHFKPGQTIFEQGDTKAFGLYIILSGSVDVIVDGEKVRSLTEGSYFGEVALVSKTAHGHTASIKVPPKARCDCLLIEKADFNKLLQESPQLQVEMQIKVLGDQVDLDQLLLHPLGRESFLEHCKHEFAVENVDFWQQVSQLENLGERRIAKSVLVALKADIDSIKERKRKMLVEKATDIFKLYILQNSPQEVNIPAEMRETLIERVKNEDFSYDMFAEAKLEIFRLIQADNFTRYKKSPQFTEVLAQIGQYD